MSLKREAITAAATLAVAITLAAFSVSVADKLRAGGHWPSAVPVVVVPEGAAQVEPAAPLGAALPDPVVEQDPVVVATHGSLFETVLDAELSFGTPILPVFAACQDHTSLLDGDSEFRHSHVEGADWLEYYESAALPDGGLAIRGFRAPMQALNARLDERVLLIASTGEAFVGGAWHVTAEGVIDDALHLEPTPALAITNCADARAAAGLLNAVFAGDLSGVQNRPIE